MKLSIVTTLYHSEPYLQEFYDRMSSAASSLTGDYELIFVNDGSPDHSDEKILELQEKDDRVVLIQLSRNFGHQKALVTGLNYASGDYIFMIDSDLEEDPELLALYWKEMQDSPAYDVVFGIQQKRKGNWFERISGSLYYSFFNLLSRQNYSPNTLTARLMTSQYVESLKKFEEKESDLWGVFVLAGFNQHAIPVTKGFKGKTTYSLRRKLEIALSTITTLTHRPLYLIMALGLLICLVSLGLCIYLLVDYIIHGRTDHWWMMLTSIWLIGGLVLFSIGIIGVYLGKMFLEIKNRPVSVIKTIHSRKPIKDEKRN